VRPPSLGNRVIRTGDQLKALGNWGSSDNPGGFHPVSGFQLAAGFNHPGDRRV